MIARVPMIAHGLAARVLIVGGGDGGVLREVLKHEGVESVILVDLDPGVLDFARRYFPEVSDGAFDDPRVTVEVGDGAKFVAATDRRYDLIIVDSTDPMGPAPCCSARISIKTAARICGRAA
jgi:spermidine synthase